ncbi:MAG: putative ABC transporter permease [Clostridia bacterium]|nr:putative ABC transporter permease [Clostridia bacterium]
MSKRRMLEEKTRLFYEKKINNRALRPFAYGMGPLKLFWLFTVGSVLGSFIETVWCMITKGHFEMRTGLVLGFSIPVYGIGAVLMAILLCRLYKKSNAVIFAGSAVIGAAVEYFCSLFQELVFGTVSWNYEGQFLSIGGRTSLKYAFMWGFLGVIWVKLVYPFIATAIEAIPKSAGNVLTVILVIFTAINVILSASAVLRRNERRTEPIPSNSFEIFLDEHYPDEKIDFIYPNMMQV